MGAKLELVNAALAHLGEPGFTSLDVDPPPPKLAKALAQLDGAVGVYRVGLARHPWLCALTYKELPAASRAGTWKHATVYDLPSDLVKVWEIDGDLPYEVGVETVEGQEKKVLRTNATGALKIAYTAEKPHEAMTPEVLAFMAYELAARLAGPIQSNARLGLELAKKAEVKLREAQDGEVGQHWQDDEVAPSGFAALRALAG